MDGIYSIHRRTVKVLWIVNRLTVRTSVGESAQRGDETVESGLEAIPV